MAIFSTNLVRQMYVVKSVNTTKGIDSKKVVADTANIGEIAYNKDKDGFYLSYVNAKGELMRTDIVKFANIKNVSINGKDGEMDIHAKEVSFDSTVNSGNPVAGETYRVRVAIRLAFGMGDEETYDKYGSYKAKSGDTASVVLANLAVSLAKNFSKEYSQFVDIALSNGSSLVSVTATTDVSTLTDTYTKLLIAEHIDTTSYDRGISSLEPVYFDVFTNQIVIDTVATDWAVDVDSSVVGTINNTFALADLEYFLAGEKGDLYRMLGWPNYIKTTYMIEPSVNAASLTVLNVHFYFADGGINNEESERDLLLVGSSTNVSLIMTYIAVDYVTVLGGQLNVQPV